MIHRYLWAATAAILLFTTASTARADVIQTCDGQWWPKKIREEMADAEAPSDSVLRESGRNNLELQYDTVKIGGVQISASNVCQIFSTTAFENAHFRQGDTHGQSRYWPEAADSFGEAAEALKGAAKQIAMYNRVTCLRYSGDVAKTFDAAQQLLDAFPKAYYFAKVQDLRARVMLIRKDAKGAKKALSAVIAAPGMNARDYFDAKVNNVYLLQFKSAGKDKKNYARARSAYEMIVKEIDTRTGARKEAGIQRLKALVGIGKCLVFEQDFKKARPYFDQVVTDKASAQDQQLLAQAYTGLGDVKYASVKKDLAGTEKLDKAKLPEIQARLTDAGLDYLRVAKFYVESAGDELYPATIGAARVWATQFTLDGETDCELARRAGKFFFEAHSMLPRGETKRLLTSEAKRFFAKRDEACKAAASADTADESADAGDEKK